MGKVSEIKFWQGTESQYNTTGEYKTWYNWNGGLIYTNLTIVGSPVISSNYIVTGFSTSSYYETSMMFRPGDYSFDIYLKINSGSSNDEQIFIGNGGYYNRCWGGITSDKHFWVRFNNTAGYEANICSLTGSYTINDNTDYYVHLGFDKTKYFLEYSLDGTTYILDDSYTTSTLISDVNYPLSIGANHYYNGRNEPFYGSIDLKECYIKINGNVVWKAVTNFNATPKGTLIGTPTVSNDGTISEFSSTNCCYTNVTLPTFTKCTMYCKALFESNIIYQVGIGSFTGNVQQLFKIASSTGLRVYSDTLGDVGTGTLTTGFMYWFKMEQNENTYSLYYKIDNGETIDNISSVTGWNTCTTQTATAFVSNSINTLSFGRNIDSVYYFQYWAGDIDMKNTAIFADDVKVWEGVTIDHVFTASSIPSVGNNVYSNPKELHKTVDMTKVGTPTVSSNYIASNFGSSSYLKLPSPFHPGDNTWEIVWKVKTPSSVSRRNLLFGTTDSFFHSVGGELNSNKQFGCGITSDGSSWNIGWITGTTTIDLNTWYYVKISFSGTQYKLEISTDGTNWNLEGTISSTTSIYQDGTYYLQLGTHNSDSDYYTGSIDLKECYIKINDIVFWEGVTIPTVSSIGSETITLTDTYTYDRNSSGDEQTEKTIGEAHTDYVCFINNVGIKVADKFIAVKH